MPEATGIVDVIVICRSGKGSCRESREQIADEGGQRLIGGQGLQFGVQANIRSVDPDARARRFGNIHLRAAPGSPALPAPGGRRQRRARQRE